MSTIDELNTNFFKTIEAAFDYKKNNNNTWIKKSDDGQLNKAEKKLVNIYDINRSKIEKLTKDYRSAVEPIMKVLKEGGELPDNKRQAMRKNFEVRHDEFKQQLAVIHGELKHELTVALEEPDFKLPYQLNLLHQLDFATKTQLDGLKQHAEITIRRLAQSFNEEDRRRNQIFSAKMILGASDKSQATGKYRPSTELLKQHMAEFSPDDIERDQSTKEWRLKERKKDTAEADNALMAGASITPKDLEWGLNTRNYLEGLEDKEVLEFKDLPGSGVFPWTREPLKIELNATVEADKEKNIPAAEGVVRCKIPANATEDQKDVILNSLAHIYMAKGWQSVELGYHTSEKLWEQAYLACRQAGFNHNEILFKGKLMMNSDLKAKGDKAQEALNEAYKRDEKRSTETTKAAIEKLAHVVYCPNLKEDFFALEAKDNNARLELFKQGSLQQQAEVLADYAFDEKKLPEYMKAITTGGHAEVLKKIAEPNPNRLLAAFQAIGQSSIALQTQQQYLDQMQQQEQVFKQLNTKTAASLLMQLPEAKAIKLFKSLSTPAHNNDNRKFQILADPDLSDARRYVLYMTLDDAQKDQALTSLAKENLISNQEALGAIVAQQFMNMPDDTLESKKQRKTAAFKTLSIILKDKSEENAKSVIQAVYHALPNVGGWQAAFEGMLATSSHRNKPNIYRWFQEAITSAYLTRLRNGNSYSDKDIIKILESQNTQNVEYVCYDNRNTQQTARLLAELIQEDPSKGIIISNIVAKADTKEKKENVVKILEALDPSVVANQMIDDKSLFQIIFKESKDHTFLANTLNVIYAKNDTQAITIWNDFYQEFAKKDLDFFNEDNNLFKRAIHPSTQLLINLIPAINNPHLIKNMLTTIDNKDIAQIFEQMPDKLQKTKILNALDSNQKAGVFGAFEDQEQRNFLFLYCDKEFKKSHIDSQLKQLTETEEKCKKFSLELSKLQHLISQQGGQSGKNLEERMKGVEEGGVSPQWDVQEKEQQLKQERKQLMKTANHLVVCCNDFYFSGEDCGNLTDLLNQSITPNYKLIFSHNSKMSVSFLSNCFSSFDDNNMKQAFKPIMNLDERFLGIPAAEQDKAKETYLANVGRAIAELGTPKREALFFNELSTLNLPDDAATVRAYALLGLMSKGSEEAAKKLFNDSNPQEKTALEEKLVELTKDLPLQSPLQQKLSTLVEPPAVLLDPQNQDTPALRP